MQKTKKREDNRMDFAPFDLTWFSSFDAIPFNSRVDCMQFTRGLCTLHASIKCRMIIVCILNHYRLNLI